MYTFITVLILITCILLILIVLVQNSKGGGLASNFQSSNQFMGVRKTTDFLEKATWGLAIALLVLSLVGSMSLPKGEIINESVIQEQVNDVPDLPNFPPANQPVQQEPSQDNQ